MGGYAPFVWSSFALTLVVMGIMLVAPVLRERELRRRLARFESHNAQEERS